MWSIKNKIETLRNIEQTDGRPRDEVLKDWVKKVEIRKYKLIVTK